MADTQELVLWSLEQPCPLRANPASRDDALHQAQWVHYRPQYLVSAFYVTSQTCISHPLSRQKSPKYPSDGFATDEVFAAVGGLEGLRTLCGSCPANTFDNGLAGCHGDIYQLPDSQETEDQLRSIIARKGLGPDIQANFPDFRPLWRALWAVSPLPAPAVPVLRILLGEMLAEDSQGPEHPYDTHRRDLSRFLDALDLAHCQGLRLHVELLPLGHTEDTYTIFPHCPFCKSLARGQGLFRRRYPDVLQTCPICGTEFSPARTASEKRDPWERGQLRENLGDERFGQLAFDFLIQVGETPETAALIVAEQEHKHRELVADRLACAEKYRLKNQFLAEQVYAGLTPLEPPPDGCEGRPWDNTWLSAPDLVVALSRAQNLGYTCTMLIHRGEWDDMDRFHHEVPFDPHTLLKHWQAEGCNERFHAHFEESSKVRPTAETRAESQAEVDEFLRELHSALEDEL